MIEFLVLRNPNYLKGIIVGGGKINGKNFEAVTGRHLPSIQLLRSFIWLIQSPRLMDSNGHALFAAQLAELKQIEGDLTILINNEKKVADLKEAEDKLIDEFPDLFIDTFLQEEFLVTDHPFIDVMSEKTPYLGVDVGLVFAPSVLSVFAYQGFNIYLVPVNKSTALSSFKNRDKFLKRFSIYLGITQNLTKSNYKRYENLIDGTGSMLAGCGWRLSRIWRVNVGALLYLQKDKNPIVDNTKLNASPTISLSIDINVAKAFGDLFGKTFKIQ